MTENKLYQLCREDAKGIIKTKYDTINVSRHRDELSQLTAEIYGMKLLDMVSPLDMSKDYYLRGEWEEWFKSNYANMNKHDTIGTTKDLHDHFVEQFNKEGK